LSTVGAARHSWHTGSFKPSCYQACDVLCSLCPHFFHVITFFWFSLISSIKPILSAVLYEQFFLLYVIYIILLVGKLTLKSVLKLWRLYSVVNVERSGWVPIVKKEILLEEKLIYLLCNIEIQYNRLEALKLIKYPDRVTSGYNNGNILLAKCLNFN
jgi:hypothetical protein